MDLSRFEALTRAVSTAVTRRGALGVLAGGLLGSVLGRDDDEAAASPACPRCGKCTACQTDGTCAAGCPGGCTAAALCKRAARNSDYRKLAAHLTGLGFRPKGEPEAVHLLDGEAVVRTSLTRRYGKAGATAWLMFQAEAGGAVGAAAVVKPARGPGDLLYVAGGKVKRYASPPQAATQADGGVQPADVSLCADFCAAVCNWGSEEVCNRLPAVCKLIGGKRKPIPFCAQLVERLCGTVGNAVACNRICDAACAQCECAGPCSCPGGRGCCPDGSRCCPYYRGPLPANLGQCCPDGRDCCPGAPGPLGGNGSCCPPRTYCCPARGPFGRPACCPLGECGHTPEGDGYCCPPLGAACPAGCPHDGPCPGCCSSLEGLTPWCDAGTCSFRCPPDWINNSGRAADGLCPAPCTPQTCPPGQVCCAGYCCAPGEECGPNGCQISCGLGYGRCAPGSSCCANQQSCCADYCCAPGEECGPNGCQISCGLGYKSCVHGGACCAQQQSCCADYCCAPGEECGPNGCQISCGPGYRRCDGGACCANQQTCCNGFCCAPGQVCNPGQACRERCGPGQAPCEGTRGSSCCSTAEQKCCDGVCCAPGQVCGPGLACRERCGPGQAPCEGTRGSSCCSTSERKCCDGVCCGPGQVCGPGLACRERCGPGQAPCEGTRGSSCCSTAEQACCDGVCCGPGQVCGPGLACRAAAASAGKRRAATPRQLPATRP